MLIEFKVANFRSIREEQALSLVASNYEKDLPDCVIERNLPGLAGVKFLRGAAIYGANASGKSNVLKAVQFLADFVRHSATKIEPGDPTGTEPFKLDQISIHQPSKFEITFVVEEIRYLFGLSLTTQRVLEEYLVAYPKGLPQRWYHRTYDERQNIYTWEKPATGFKRDKSLEIKTRENALFISVATQFNHPQLTPIFSWFQHNLQFNPTNSSLSKGIHKTWAIKKLREYGYFERVQNLLRSADIGIADIKITQSKDENKTSSLTNSYSEESAHVFEKNIRTEEGEIQFIHKASDNQDVLFDYNSEESEGTRRFFELTSSWIDILEHGNTAFLDEIEISLHPLLVRELLKLLFCRKNNPKGAQIIFTTHNPILLDTTLMRRDQIWFTEKSPAGATHLYPLTDYQPRKDEALTKGYLAGRYGGIPFIPEGLKL
ncbi:ATP/GTP-binding protein [Candidatus Cyanaurora vandensis]|uniref:AAA family ATPase n=1 Tax=Candidatus Cyanaurora vandensis TaxID=2714958 RepID=UPI00257999D4|nr:ATP-binding protein [Candidatus Cyanaurora vandensis]